MSAPPVAVVGGSLAGMAAAARLAKAGHRVLLFEAADTLGGRWARPGALPPVFTLPAPWRDLFRKSGRPFDTELARTGHALVPAPAATHHFTDGSNLQLPTDRGEQWTVLSRAWGTAAAARWRDLLDDLDGRWQVLRRLGLEDEFTDAALTRERRNTLGLGRSIADLASAFRQPQAAELIRSTAWRIGSDPTTTPEFVAVRLALERTFGRWQLIRDGIPVPAGDLIDLLAARLVLRGVEVRTGEPVRAIAPGSVRTADDTVAVAATVVAVNPWEFLRLTYPGEGRLRRRTRWTRPALAPVITVLPRTVAQEMGFATAVGGETHPVLPAQTEEQVHHARDGVRIRYDLPAVTISHDFGAGRAQPTPGFGTRWTSPRTWLREPPLRADTAKVYTASASSRGGNDPWAQLLSGALVTYVVHERLTGADIRPTNKALKN